MIAWGRLYHLARADFLERTRRYGFLVVMGLTLYAGYMMVPAADAPYNAFSIGGHRPYYSAAWIGTIFGTVCGTLLTLLGFFLVRNSVGRDHDTRVGRIIAGTPTTRLAYVLGKWLSNLTVFAAILVVLMVVAPLMQVVRGEDLQIDLVAQNAALWLIGLPPLALVAALAVLFETTPLLRGPLGSVLFVAIWAVVLVFPVGTAFTSRRPISPLADVTGISPSMTSLYAAAEDAGLEVDSGTTDLFEPTGGRVVRRFPWTGVRWSASAVAVRFAWLAVALAVAAAAAVPFDRFDTSRARAPRERKARRRRGRQVPVASAAPLIEVAAEVPAAAPGRLSPLAPGHAGAGLLPLVRAELRTMIRGRPWWWYAAALALVVATLAVPERVATGLIAPGLWLLPITVWSALGNREVRLRATSYVFSAPHPVTRQLPATWLAGVLIGLAVATIAAVRPLLAGDAWSLGGLAVGALFVPSLALALGVWTRGSRAFETVYVVLWYLGVFVRMTTFDFLGAKPQSMEEGVPYFYLVLAVLLLALSFAGRRRQILHSA